MSVKCSQLSVGVVLVIVWGLCLLLCGGFVCYCVGIVFFFVWGFILILWVVVFVIVIFVWFKFNNALYDKFGEI